jgi:hypothetical protein
MRKVILTAMVFFLAVIFSGTVFGAEYAFDRFPPKICQVCAGGQYDSWEMSSAESENLMDGQYGFEIFEGGCKAAIVQRWEEKIRKVCDIPIGCGSFETEVLKSYAQDGFKFFQKNEYLWAYQPKNMKVLEKPAKLTVTVSNVAAVLIRVMTVKPVYEPGIKLPPGKHLIIVSHPAYETQKREVELASGEVREEIFVLNKKTFKPKPKKAQKKETVRVATPKMTTRMIQVPSKPTPNCKEDVAVELPEPEVEVCEDCPSGIKINAVLPPGNQ